MKKMKKWLLNIAVALVMCLSLLPATALAADGDVEYRYYDENEASWEAGTKSGGEYTVVTSSDTAWGAKETETWYVVNDNVTIGTADSPQHVIVSGQVHLILADDCTLTVTGGVKGYTGSKLTIYAQENGTGTLTAYGPDTSGGNKDSYGIYIYDLTICGGTVNATGGAAAAASSCGIYLNSISGRITIRGGTVNATGGPANTADGAAAYSEGIHAYSGLIISGGTVNATGDTATAPETGGDAYSRGIYVNSLLTISGDTAEVTAMGGTATAGGSGSAYSFGIQIEKNGGDNFPGIGGRAVTAMGGTATAGGSGSAYSCGIWNRDPVKFLCINGGTVNAAGVTAIAEGSGSAYSYGIYSQRSVEVNVDDGMPSVTATGGRATSAGSDAYSEGICALDYVAINGGTVNATGGAAAATGQSGRAYSYGIRSAGTFGYTKTVTINGGTVNATGTSAGIGGSFKTTGSNGVSGNAIIRASSIDDHAYEEQWSGVIFEGSSDKVYGSPTLNTDLTIADTETLTIPTGSILIVQDGVKLTNNGTLTNNGAIYVDGTLTGTVNINGNGALYYPLTLINCTAGEANISTYNSKTYGKVGAPVTLSANTPQPNQVFSGWTLKMGALNMSMIGENTFSMPNGAVTAEANFVDALQCTVQTDTPSITYGGTATLTVSVQKYEYNASNNTEAYVPLTETPTYQWYLGTELVGSEASYTTPTDLGAGTHSYTCQVSWSGYTAQASADLAVNRKTIEGASVTLGESLTYNGSSQTQTVTKVELDGVDITKFCDVSDNVQTDAGSYTLTVTAMDGSNYTGSVNKDFTIARKSITPTIEVNGTYTYTCSAITPDFTVKDGSTALTADDYTAVISDNINAGSGKITVTAKADGNYSFSEMQKDFTIGKADYNGTTTATCSAMYGTTRTVDLSSYLASGGSFGTVTKTDTNSVLSGDPVMEGNSLKFTFVDNAANVNKTATITVPVNDATNYSNYSITVTVTVEAKEVPNVTAPTAVANLTYTGQAQILISAGSTSGGTLQYKVEGGEYSTALPVATNAGVYTVYYKVIGNSEYADVAESSLPVTIDKKEVTAAPKNVTITRGSAIPAFELTYTGLAGDDTLTPDAAPTFTCFEADGTTAVSTGTAAGTYTITWTNTDIFDGEANYKVVDETGTLTINNPNSGGTTYPPVVEQPDEGGTVTVSPKHPSAGDRVTITPKPEKGYEVGSITVTDKNGSRVKVTDNGDGTYSFTQPAGKVTINVVFSDATVIPFVDVPTNTYYYDAVQWAVKKGITHGTSDTTFSPKAPCTRAQMVTFLWRAAGCPTPKSSEMPFKDVVTGRFYETAVLWAVENGITKGTSATTFSPDATCNRAQFATFLWRSQGMPDAGTSNPFTDVAEDTYYTDAVLWAAENHITNGTSSTTFSPYDDCTRAQTVTFLYRCLGK